MVITGNQKKHLQINLMWPPDVKLHSLSLDSPDKIYTLTNDRYGLGTDLNRIRFS